MYPQKPSPLYKSYIFELLHFMTHKGLSSCYSHCRLDTVARNIHIIYPSRIKLEELATNPLVLPFESLVCLCHLKGFVLTFGLFLRIADLLPSPTLKVQHSLLISTTNSSPADTDFKPRDFLLNVIGDRYSVAKTCLG